MLRRVEDVVAVIEKPISFRKGLELSLRERFSRTSDCPVIVLDGIDVPSALWSSMMVTA